jgi:ion channel-forming bestrophin family protein
VVPWQNAFGLKLPEPTMIQRDRPSALRLFFVWRGSIIAGILPQIVGFALYASAIVVVTRALGLDLSRVGVAPFALVGVALSIYLSFRNSAAYDRWWEARRLWGQLIAESRTLSRTTEALLTDPDLRRRFLLGFLGFCHLLRGQLRNIDVRSEASAFLSFQAHSSTDALARMGHDLAVARGAGTLDLIGHRILEERLTAVTLVEAGCERIAGTPLPFAYTLLLHRTAYLFCLLLPFGLVTSAGWATPLFTALIAYTFFGLDRLSEELEDPFGTDANDLPLDSLCRTCEISVLRALGDPTPSPLLPRGYIVS